VEEELVVAVLDGELEPDEEFNPGVEGASVFVDEPDVSEEEADPLP
jgi:hypothetical protein